MVDFYTVEYAGFVFWSTKIESRFGRGYVNQCSPYKALKLIAGGKLTFDDRVVPHPVEGEVD